MKKEEIETTSALKREKSKILKLEATCNTRDLGGYKTLDGKVTKYKVFLRSDDTDELTENDIKTLKNYGVKTVIDMRDKAEIAEHPDKLNLPRIDYYHVDVKDNYSKKYNRAAVHMSDGYIDFINYTDDGNWLTQVFNIIANAKAGCVLFHCVSGKDRTGLVAAFLLGLVNVSDQDIVENYRVSWNLIKERPKIKEVYRLKSLKCDKYDFDADISKAKRIQEVLDYIKEKHGTFENCLLSCGVSRGNLDKIKLLFTQL
jgi:protein-tyrosine phosphatase